MQLIKKMQPKKERHEPVVESDNLTEKQRLFCIYYIKYFNATKAYQKAYECAYSTAMVDGHRYLRNPKISAEIDRMKEEQTNELKLDVCNELQKYITFADITDITTFSKKERQVMGMFGLVEDDNNYVNSKDSSHDKKFQSSRAFFHRLRWRRESMSLNDRSMLYVSKTSSFSFMDKPAFSHAPFHFC